MRTLSRGESTFNKAPRLRLSILDCSLTCAADEHQVKPPDANLKNSLGSYDPSSARSIGLCLPSHLQDRMISRDLRPQMHQPG